MRQLNMLKKKYCQRWYQNNSRLTKELKKLIHSCIKKSKNQKSSEGIEIFHDDEAYEEMFKNFTDKYKLLID